MLVFKIITKFSKIIMIFLKIQIMYPDYVNTQKITSPL